MILIYEILKIIFLQGFLKNLNFFEKKKEKIINFKQSLDCSKVNINFFGYEKCTVDYL